MLKASENERIAKMDSHTTCPHRFTTGSRLGGYFTLSD